jgi:hypothetical protein
MRGQKFKYPVADITLENDSRVHWPRLERHRRGQARGVPTTCGGCGHEHLAVPSHAIREGFTGLCAKCFHKSRTQTGIEYIGDKGSYLDHDRSDPTDQRKRYFKCGVCRGEWYAFPRSRRDRKKLRDLCPKCDPRTYTGEKLLRRGTNVLFDKRRFVETASGKGYYKVAIQCRGCFKATGEEKYVNLGMVTKYMAGTNKKHYDELCGDCVRERGSLKKSTYKRSDSGTEFFFPRETDKPVRIVYARCRHEYQTSWSTAINAWKKWSDICPACQKDRDAYDARILELAGLNVENGSEQQNGNREKRKTGRKPITDAEYEQLITGIRRTVLSLRDKGTPRAEATSNAVASILHIGSKETGGDTMMRRLRKRSKEKWPAYRDSIWDGEING